MINKIIFVVLMIFLFMFIEYYFKKLPSDELKDTTIRNLSIVAIYLIVMSNSVNLIKFIFYDD